MTKYVEKALRRFNHVAKAKGRKQHFPHVWNKPAYRKTVHGKTVQYTATNNSELAPKSARKYVQQIVGTFLYYVLALNLSMLVAIGSVASRQNNPTKMTMSQIIWFLDYCAAHPDTCIEYTASGMILWTGSDASYLSESNARSRAGALFFLGPKPTLPGKPPKTQPGMNGVVYALEKNIDTVMSSAMESEGGAIFLAAKEALLVQILLEEMGHPQPPTPIQVDNTTAVGFCNNTIKHRRSKAIDM